MSLCREWLAYKFAVHTHAVLLFFFFFFLFLCFFFFKQKTAYEIVDCDWSSDVCSSDLVFRI